MTKASSKDVRFWDRFARRYSTNPIPNPDVYERKLALTRQYLKPDMIVFEFGCGTGSTAILHAPFVEHIWATDYSQNMINIARRKAVDQKIANVRFDCADILDFEPNKEPFDVVLGLNVIHLLKNPEQVLRRAHSLLKPGGFLVSSTACLQDHKYLRFLKFVAPIGSFLGLIPSCKVFSKAELLALHQKTGFAIEVDWSPQPGSVFLIAKKIEQQELK